MGRQVHADGGGRGGGVGLWVLFAVVLLVACALIVAQCAGGAR
jgi:hypothetical protein